ncbi:MAG: protein kinase [Cyanobacteriota bacterium]|nr:protein kinase [Cyanobacteriota bacterium]
MQTPNCFCLNPACLQPENLPDAEICSSCGSRLQIRNRYRAFKKIGQGGFGATFLAQDGDLPSKPWRVIKQLRPAENSPQIAQLSLELFNREAQVLEKLGEHSQIPKLFAYFEENSKFYLVQEYIQGITLSQELHRNGGPMNEEQVRQIMQEMLLILSYVHSHNTVHRDIKPANLIRRKADQRLVLIDFGAVKELGPPGKEQAVEVTAIRSLGFSPPEQINGQPVGPPSDLYALAATCINLLTMESPAKFIDQNQNRWDWSSRLQLSPEFDAILYKMLQPAINLRYASATEVLRALQGMGEEAISQPIILPKSYGPAPTAAPPSPLISGHWGSRRSEGFQPVPTVRPPITGSSGGFTSGGSGLSMSGGRTSTTGFSRTQPTTPRVVSMAGADLRGKSFTNQNLSGRDMRRADIRGTDFSGANLQRSDLRGIIFNKPQPPWLRTLSWIFGQAKTLTGIAAGLAALMGAGIVAFLVVFKLVGYFWVAIAAAVMGAVMAWSAIWSLTGRVSLTRYNEEHSKRHTSLRKTDLRGAQMEDKLRQFARHQGAILD